MSFSSSLRILSRSIFSSSTRSAVSLSSFNPIPVHAAAAARHFSHGISQHRPADYNSPDMKWAFSSENMKKVEKILKKFPTNYKQSAVMPLLTLAQEQHDNWLPLAAMNKIAEMLEMPPIRVYEVATFYSMYNREKLGKWHIQLCGTTPCMLCGAEKLGETLEKHLGVKAGEITKDGLFTWTEVECLGACANAPMIQVNNHEFYENLTSETLINVVEQLRAGKKPKVGPQNGQKAAEGIMGKTSLKGEPSGPFCRDLDAAAAQYKADQEKAKAAAAAAAAAVKPPAPAAAKP